MLWAALAFALGAFWGKLAANTLWTPPNWQVFACVLLLILAAFCVSAHPHLASTSALTTLLLLGMAQFEVPHLVGTLPAGLENRQVEITGFVNRASVPILESSSATSEWRTTAHESYQQVDILVEEIRCIDCASGNDAGTISAPRLGVRVSIYETIDEADAEQLTSSTVPTTLGYGQRVRIRGSVRTHQTYEDPGVFDRRAYLLQNGIAAVLSARAEDISPLPGIGGSRFGRWRAEARASLLRHVIALHSPEGQQWRVFSISQTDAALLAAMILGERSLLDQSVKLDFQRTGSYHLLVVSGMAVAILAFAVFWLARWLRLPDSIATALSVIFVALYVAVTDLGAPVQRAALMCAIYMLARLFYRERNPLNAIGAAALVVLVIDAKALFDAGFQMTFLAVLSIAGIAVPIMGRSTGYYRKALYQIDSTSFDIHLDPRQAQFRLDLRLILGRLDLLVPLWLARFLLIGGTHVVLRTVEVIFISALMQATLALPMALYFHRATTLALPANVLVVPIMTLLLPMALATTLLSYIGGWIAFLPRYMTALLLHSVSASVVTFARFRAADWRVPDPPLWAAVLCIVAVAACVCAATRRAAIVFAAFALLAASDIAVIHARKPDQITGKLEITAIDVGQGDSLLVVTPLGKSLLIDGGGTLGSTNSGFDVGEDVVSPYLWARGFAYLDAVALTHAHSDHIGGLPAVLRNFHPAELWVAPSPPTAAYEALIAQASRVGIAVKTLAAEDKFTFGGANFEVFAPARDATINAARNNDDSMVLKVTFKNTSALLEGDAERRTERAIAPQLGAVNLLKVAHHGSSTSSIGELLAATRPEFAVISVGRFNRYGHPRSNVLDRLSGIGSCTFRTDLTGAVSFYLDGRSLTSTRWGTERQTMQFPSRWIPRDQAGHCAAAR